MKERKHAFDLVRSMRAFTSRWFREGGLLGENNLPPEEELEYFGSHSEMRNMQFKVVLNQAMADVAGRDPEPRCRALEDLPGIPSLEVEQ